jgi:exosome complex RNA-binding protein Csl4
MYENSNKKEKQTVIVEVYRKNNENFLATSICSKLHIKPESDKYKINGIECYKISDLLLHQIERYENATQ